MLEINTELYEMSTEICNVPVEKEFEPEPAESFPIRDKLCLVRLFCTDDGFAWTKLVKRYGANGVFLH